MNIVETKPTVSISTLRTGDVFKYNGEYYLVTDAYFGQYTTPDKHVYANLRTGYWKSIPNALVEPVTDVSLVIGKAKSDGEGEDDEL